MSSTTEHHRQFGHTLHDTAPSSQQAAKFVTATTVGGCLLVLAALILTGTVIALVLATPVLVLFSPILVPAAITLAMIAGGFIFSGTCGVAAISALSWMYRYVTGKHPPPGADRVDYARMTIADKARDMTDYVQHKAHQATRA